MYIQTSFSLNKVDYISHINLQLPNTTSPLTILPSKIFCVFNTSHDPLQHWCYLRESDIYNVSFFYSPYNIYLEDLTEKANEDFVTGIVEGFYDIFLNFILYLIIITVFFYTVHLKLFYFFCGLTVQ